MEGHIKLHRKMLDWEWYLDIHTKSLFLHLLLKANWKPGRYMGIEVDRGELVSTYSNLAIETGLSVKAVRVALNHLIKTGEVTINGQSKFTIIRIENYDAYQTEGKERAEEGQDENEQKAEKGHDKGKQKVRNHQENEHQMEEMGQTKGKIRASKGQT